MKLGQSIDTSWISESDAAKAQKIAGRHLSAEFIRDAEGNVGGHFIPAGRVAWPAESFEILNAAGGAADVFLGRAKAGGFVPPMVDAPVGEGGTTLASFAGDGGAAQHVSIVPMDSVGVEATWAKPLPWGDAITGADPGQAAPTDGQYGLVVRGTRFGSLSERIFLPIVGSSLVSDLKGPASPTQSSIAHDVDGLGNLDAIRNAGIHGVLLVTHSALDGDFVTAQNWLGEATGVQRTDPPSLPPDGTPNTTREADARLAGLFKVEAEGFLEGGGMAGGLIAKGPRAGRGRFQEGGAIGHLAHIPDAGGPIMADGCGKHRYSQGPEGKESAGHISTDAFFRVPGLDDFDGPIDFRPEKYRGGGVLGVNKKVFVEMDLGRVHRFNGRNRIGKWRFRTTDYWIEPTKDIPGITTPPLRPPGDPEITIPPTEIPPTIDDPPRDPPIAPGLPFEPPFIELPDDDVPIAGDPEGEVTIRDFDIGIDSTDADTDPGYRQDQIEGGKSGLETPLEIGAASIDPIPFPVSSVLSSSGVGRGVTPSSFDAYDPTMYNDPTAMAAFGAAPRVSSIQAWSEMDGAGNPVYQTAPQDYQHARKPAKGGMIVVPPEVDLSDPFGMLDPDTTTQTYLGIHPGVCLAAGLPASDGSMVDGHTLQQSGAAGVRQWRVSAQDASGANAPGNDFGFDCDVDMAEDVIIGGSGKTVGYFGAVGTTLQTVTGSRMGNPALTSFLAAKAAYGQIINNTTP